MSSNKKNQHYIPKFYLRNFSYKKNLKQIGIFNVTNKFYFQKAPIKSQGSKSFFYGEDGIIEDLLSLIENEFASHIKNIIVSVKIPEKGSLEHYRILEFIILSDLRNPVLINYSKQTRKVLKQKLEELHPGKSIDENIVKEITHKEAVSLALSSIRKVIVNTVDLGMKLLINKTNIPFITSDYPIVKYNQFFEEKKYPGGKSGYGSKGLQLFFPISPEIILILYDTEIYKVGFNKRDTLNIENEQAVKQLNLLQLLNCQSTLFFNEKISKHYIERLFDKSKNYRKANIIQPKIYKSIDYEVSKSNYISFGVTDCEIALEIQGIKFISGVRNVKLPNSMAILRSKVEKI
jgi:hypothetical protein